MKACFFWLAQILVIAPAAARGDATRLQSWIDEAPPHGEVIVPKGAWSQPITITKPIRLRGEAVDACVIEVTADQPAFRITTKEEVVLESLTIRWQRATSERLSEPLAAVWLRDSPVKLRSVRFYAPGNNVRCPSAISASGFSDLTVEESHFEGFDFTVQFFAGAKGRVADSVVWKPGHCGITVGPDCSVEVIRCVVAGSGYHGIRCTGGRLMASDNLVISNQNRGFYLGNKSATGAIRNNVIQGNGTGISGFAQSEVEVANNLISKSDFAGLDARDTCRLQVRNNLFVDNTRGLVLFKESGKNVNSVATNLFWGNQKDTEGFERMPEVVRADPQLTNLAGGEFIPRDPALLKRHGLRDPTPMKALWVKWTALRENARE